MYCGYYVKLWFVLLTIYTTGLSGETCDAPNFSIKAEVDASKSQIQGAYKKNTILYYKCKDGYHFKNNVPRHKMKCSDGRIWEPSPYPCYDSCNNQCGSYGYCHDAQCICDQAHGGKYCRETRCNVPTLNEGRVIKIEDMNPTDTKNRWVGIGTKIQFVCNPGYSIKKGSSVHVCTPHGWDFPTVPICEQNFCRRQSINHGTPQPDMNTYLSGSKIVFACDPGYFLKEQKQLTCQNSGVWTGTWPNCVEKNCPTVILSNGIYDSSRQPVKDLGYPINTALGLNCLSGYVYLGVSKKIRCQGPPLHLTVKWSSPPGQCISENVFSNRCKQEGKVMKSINGRKVCIFAPTEPIVYISSTKSAMKKTEKPLTIVTSTAGGLLLLLLLVITIVACQRRRLAQLQRGRTGRHRLNSDDDRLSFVYYSNDVHVVLPSYDEAMQARRIHHPPPYAAQEDEANRNAAVSGASSTVAPTSTTQDSDSNLYETIDEIRTNSDNTVSSLTTTENDDENDNVVVGATASSVENNNVDTTDSELNNPDYGIYDGPTDEPIYTSVQRVLSRSLLLADQGLNRVNAETVELQSTPSTSVMEEDISLESPSLSSDEDEADTKPLI